MDTVVDCGFDVVALAMSRRCCALREISSF